jgi:heat shock protein HslJ
MKRSIGGIFLAVCFSIGVPLAAWCAQPAPTLQELKNTTYTGLETDTGPVTLKDGRWEGKPFVEGGASRPTVTLMRDFRLTGDLDGDGSDEAAVLLAEDSGGSGTFYYLAVVARRNGKLHNVATQGIGDRLQLRDAEIEGKRIVLELVQAGPRDAACCPGDLVRRAWTLSPAGLKEQPVCGKVQRLTLDTVGGVTWVLRAWNINQPAPPEPAITLIYKDGRFTGFSGCNQYFAEARAGDMPGDVKVGPVGATRRACPESQTVAETRFQQQLAGVKRYGFMVLQLALTYEKDGTWGVMLFDRKTP